MTVEASVPQSSALERPTGFAAPEDHPLVVWAGAARAAHSIAMSLARGPFVSATIRFERTSRDGPLVERPLEMVAADVTAIILTGHEMGLQPMAALRSIDVINGVPAMRALTLVALVQSRGHRVWVHESTAARAIVKGCRLEAQGRFGLEQTATFTFDDAKNLNLANKPNYKSQPATMLRARASSALCRMVAADALLGIPYSVEELQDDLAGVAAPVAAEPSVAEVAAPSRTVQRRPVSPAQARRSAPPVPADEVLPEAGAGIAAEADAQWAGAEAEEAAGPPSERGEGGEPGGDGPPAA